MFGISFSELLLVGLVALLVLGPERLPGAARTAGLWIGRLKRSFNSIKSEIEREIGADEIRRQLHNEHILSLEQEARKILNPEAEHKPEPKPADPPLVAPEHNPAQGELPLPPVINPPPPAPVNEPGFAPVPASAPAIQPAPGSQPRSEPAPATEPKKPHE